MPLELLLLLEYNSLCLNNFRTPHQNVNAQKFQKIVRIGSKGQSFCIFTTNCADFESWLTFEKIVARKISHWEWRFSFKYPKFRCFRTFLAQLYNLQELFHKVVMFMEVASCFNISVSSIEKLQFFSSETFSHPIFLSKNPPY